MKEIYGVFRYEYFMSIRRRSLWLVFGLLTIPYLTTLFTPPSLGERLPRVEEVLQFTGTYAFMLNLFMPVVGGILAADRLVRDQKLGVDELLKSTMLTRRAYLAGKYLAAVCSIVTPVIASSLLIGLSLVATGAPWQTLPAMLLAFLGINLPAYIFIIAFALGCPLIMPVRVFQVLFTGYWFWGNFLSPQVMPTLNGTYLTANGEFVLFGLFGGFFGGGGPSNIDLPNSVDALINLALLAACAALALVASDRVLAWRARRA